MDTPRRGSGSNGEEESWLRLGSALRSVQSVSLAVPSRDTLLAVLPHLQSCQSLSLLRLNNLDRFQPVGSAVSRLPNLRDLFLFYYDFDFGVRTTKCGQYDVLNMITSSNSIENVQFRGTLPSAFQGRIDSFCILNRVFGTTLVGFEPTDLWTRVLSKIGDCSARSILLYRLLCEKPELIPPSRRNYC